MAKSRHGQRRGGSLRRDVAVRTPKRTFLVFCEGEKTEPANLKALKRDPAVRDVASVDIRVDVSNPCFELWLALHFEDHTAGLDTAAAIRLRRTLDGTSGKDLDGETHMPRRAKAARRARALDERHRGNGTEFPRDNPSSGMFRFLDAIEGGEVRSG